MVQPEGEPGDGDRHGAGDVDGDDEERELAGKHEVHLQTGILAWHKQTGIRDVSSACNSGNPLPSSNFFKG